MFPLDVNMPVIMKNGTRKTLADITGDIPGIVDDIDTIETAVSVLGDYANNLAANFAYVNTDKTKASKNYSTGDEFVFNGVLVKAKTDITSGDTLTLDTNYELADTVTTQISNFLILDKATKNVTVPGNSSLSVTLDNPTHSGYRLAGIISIDVGATGLIVTSFQSFDTSSYVYLYNRFNGDATVNLDIRLLYIKRGSMLVSNL